MSESLTASEAEHLVTLPQRFTEHHLDQFDNWRFSPTSKATTPTADRTHLPNPTRACSPPH